MKRYADNAIRFGHIVFDWKDAEETVTVHALCHDCGQADTYEFPVATVEDECANVSATHDQVCNALD